MKKRIATVALACLMVMTTMVGVAMAADTEADALALSAVDVFDIKAVPATSETNVVAIAEASGHAEDGAVSIESLPYRVLEDVEVAALVDHARATNSVNWKIDPQSGKQADTPFSLEAGETVTINCSYSPRSAAVDFGLLAPDGRFYYVSGSNGSINKTLEVVYSGQYILAMWNNSNNTVTVTGFVNY